MQPNLQKKNVSVCEMLLDTAVEYPIECDVLLPDYCPDIVRILSCRVLPVIQNSLVRRNQFVVEGVAEVQLCYAAKVGGIRKAEYKIPFSKSFELKTEPASPIWCTDARAGQINCRAASPRRFDMRGTVIISAKLFDTAKREVLAEAQGCGVETLSSQEEMVDFAGQLRREFSVTERLGSAVGKSAAVEVLLCRCRAVVTESRVMASRVIIKGELLVHLLYKTDADTGAMETADYTLPLSRVIEGERLGDELICDSMVQCVSAQCQPDEDGEDGEMRLEAVLLCDVHLFAPQQLSCLTDSFSTLYPTANSFSRLRILKSCTTVFERVGADGEIPTEQNVTAVLDCFGEVSGQSMTVTAESITVEADIKVCAFISTDELEADSINGVCRAKITLPVSGSAGLLGCIQVTSTTARISDGAVSVQCEATLSGVLLRFAERTILSDIAVDENNPRSIDPAVGLTVYYAAKGESVWDIAKRYGSLPRQIMEDNELLSEVLEDDTPLMIPTL